MRSFNPVYTRALGSGGGGAYWGTSSTTTLEINPALGFYLVAPLLYLRNATTAPGLNTVLQATSTAPVFGLEQPDVAFNYARKVAVTLANLYPSNVQPRKGPVLWSTVVCFTSPTTFEVFAFIWTLAASYEFVGALTAFVVIDGVVGSAGPTTLRLTTASTVATPMPLDPATPSPSPFLTTAVLSSGTLADNQRSSTLQNWVLGLSASG